MSRAVVFAYHNVGVRCLSALLGRGVEVALVVTHRDNPAETIWFGSVQQLAESHVHRLAHRGACHQKKRCLSNSSISSKTN